MSPLSLIKSINPFNHQFSNNVTEIYRRVSNKSAFIPMFGSQVSAGFPSPAADHIEARLSADQYLVENPISTYFVRVRGDSMIDAGIFEGDVLVVDRSLEPSIGNIILAEVDGAFTVKRLGQQQLIPENAKYKPLNFDEAETIALIGVVTGSMRKFL